MHFYSKEVKHSTALMLWMASVLFVVPITTFAQSHPNHVPSTCEGSPLIGLPQITNYSMTDLPSASIQSWNGVQDSRGILMIANNGGLVEFDGNDMSVTLIPGNNVYDVALFRDTVYYASNGQIGYFGADSLNRTVAKSWQKEYPEIYNALGTVWVVESHSDGVYWRDGTGLIRWDGNELKRWEMPGRPAKVFSIQDTLFTLSGNNSLYFLDNDSLVAYPGGEALRGASTQAMGVWNGNIIAFTRFKGVMLVKPNAITPLPLTINKWLIDKGFYNGIHLNDGGFALGSLTDGVLIIDNNLNPILHLNTDNGLINNVAQGFFQDHEDGIWVTTMGGLSHIEWPPNLSYFTNHHGLMEPILKVHAGKSGVFAGSGERVYKMTTSCNEYGLRTAKFHQVIEDSKIVEHFLELDDEILVSTNSGLYSVKGGIVKRIMNGMISSSWYDKEANLLFTAFKDQIFLFQKQNEEWVSKGRISNLNFETLTLIAQSNTIFSNSRDTLFRRIIIDDLHQKLGRDAVIRPDTIFEYRIPAVRRTIRSRLYYLNDEPHFTNSSNLFRYDAERDTFVVAHLFDEEFQNGRRQFYAISQENQDRIWLRSNVQNQVAVRQDNGEYEIFTSPLNRFKDRRVFWISALDGNAWFSGANGISFVNTSVEKVYTIPFKTSIRRVYAKSDSLIYAGFPSNDASLTNLEYSDNDMRFTFAAHTFGYRDAIQYQSRLVPYDKDWSRPTDETRRDYTGLPEGTYTFEVKATNIDGVESSISIYSFRILPPWYRTWWALSFFGISGIGLLYTGYKYRVNYLIGIERARHTIARDLHDDVSATLSSINFFTEAIKRKPDSQNTVAMLERISLSAIDAQDKIQDIIWSVSPDHDSWEQLFPKMNRYISDLCEPSGIDYYINMPKQPPSGEIDMYLRKDLWLMFKEMVTNAAEHSQCKLLTVKIQILGGYLFLTVKDDGRGFDKEVLTERNGLKNIMVRAKRHHATITLTTAPGEGTEWNLKIKTG
jgi:hypothetical protein